MSALLKLIATAAIATAIASPSIAQTLNGEPCPQCVARPDPIPFVRPVLGWNPAPAYSPNRSGIMIDASKRLDYESHSRSYSR